MSANATPQFQLTDEQAHAVARAGVCGSLKVEAFAGTGKTATLLGIARSRPAERMLYLAFNRDIAEEGKRRFPAHVTCSTTHGLAMRHSGIPYRERLARQFDGNAIMEALQLPAMNASHRRRLGWLLRLTLNRFCQSKDDAISLVHVPAAAASGRSRDAAQVLMGVCVKQAQRAWELMQEPSSALPVTHDFYLKLWQLSRPRIEADCILFDEAQDASEVLLDVLGRQGHARRVYVGDRYQQIYAWRGALNAMQHVETEDTCRITQSFRFGEPIARLASNVLNTRLHAKVRILGEPSRHSKVVHHAIRNPDVVLCRSNAGLVRELMRLQTPALGRPRPRVAVAGGGRELEAFLRGALELQRGRPARHAELGLFSTWEEVMAFAKTDEGQHLAGMAALADTQVHEALAAVRSVPPVQAGDAALLLSTVHKAKGQEWDRVRLAGDYLPAGTPCAGTRNEAEEAHLLYVAVTRARSVLDISALPWMGPQAQAPPRQDEAPF